MASNTLCDLDSVQIVANKWLQDVRQYQDNVDTLFKHGTINAALANIGTSTQTTIVVTENTPVNASTDITSHPNISWLFLGAGKLTPAVGVTLTLYSPDTIIAPPQQQILDTSSGTVAFAQQGVVYPNWFGAVMDGTTDDSVKINKALATGAHVCLIGTYRADSVLVMDTDYQMLFGRGRESVIKNQSASGIFTAIAIEENTVGVILRDFELRGNASSEPAVNNPVRGITLGTASSGTAHSVASWDAYATIERVHITGVTPGTTGFNVGIQMNKGGHSRVEACTIESLYGTNPNYGHAVVCNASDTDIIACTFRSTITGQGRHACYFTNTPSRSRAIDCRAYGFQAEAFVTNNDSGGEQIGFIHCWAVDCMASATGTTQAPFLIQGGSANYVSGCRVIGSTLGSNRFGLSVQDCPRTIVSDLYLENINQHGIFIESSTGTQLTNFIINEAALSDATTYGGVVIQTCDDISITNGYVIGPARFAVRFDSSSPTPNNCRISGIRTTGTFNNSIIENNTTNISTNRIEEHVVATANLPAAATAMDGRMLIEDAGAGNRNLIIYAGAQRFRIDGGANF